MGLVSGVVIFVVLWWLTLYTVLPWGIRPCTQLVKGQETGAPQKANMKKKLIVTTLISFLLWSIIYIIIDADIPYLNELFMG
jgi:predicted secreted protein